MPRGSSVCLTYPGVCLLWLMTERRNQSVDNCGGVEKQKEDWRLSKVSRSRNLTVRTRGKTHVTGSLDAIYAEH